MPPAPTGSRVHVTTKDGRVGLSSSADRASQPAAVAVLRDAYPDHDLDGTDRHHVWLVDGLDGTGTFANGIPRHRVSVALRWR